MSQAGDRASLSLGGGFVGVIVFPDMGWALSPAFYRRGTGLREVKKLAMGPLVVTGRARRGTPPELRTHQALHQPVLSTSGPNKVSLLVTRHAKEKLGGSRPAGK